MRFLVFLVVIISSAFYSYAQYQEVARYTVAEGLSSNTLYNCVEDHQGFLWISSDQGAIRFDGKYFQQFTSEQGLPDNDILKMLIEENGRVWVHSFKQTPAYFDEVKNRFISAKEDTLLRNVTSKVLLYGYNTIAGGVEFYCESGTKLFINNRKYEYSKQFQADFGLVIQRINADNCLSIAIKKDTKKLVLYNISYNKIKEQKDLGVTGGTIFFNNVFIHENKLYCLVSLPDVDSSYRFVCLSNIKANPLRFDIDSMLVKKSVNQISITNHFIIVNYNAKNRFEIFNKETKKLVQTIHTTYAVNSVFEDSNNELWVCTVGQGLIKLKQTQIQKMKLPDELNSIPFLCISGNHNGTLFLGTTKNQIIECSKEKFTIHKLPTNPVTSGWQRDILFSNQKIYTFSDAGCYVNYTQPILDPKQKFILNAKAAIVLNDSIIVCGTHARFYKINTITNKVEGLFNQETRVTSLLAYNSNIIYYGSINGLHKYNIVKKENIKQFEKNLLLNERVVSLCMDTDSIIWVASAGNGVIGVRHDSVIAHITTQQGLNSNSVLTISKGRSKQTIVGTTKGIAFIDYSKSIQHPSIKNISVSDGLSSNLINRIFFWHDTIYVATNNGVSVIPASISIPSFDIPIQLTRIQINQKDTAIVNHYELNAKQNMINLQFAGIELGGHFKNAQLSIDRGLTWSNLTDNSLSLQFGSGEHSVWLRAIDMNRNISKQILKLQFDIEFPYYKKWWFLVLVTGLFTGFVFWIYNRRKLFIQQQILSQQLALEAQRNKFTADLHDDIGSTLSSLQVNSNVASLLLEKNKAGAREVLKKIETQSQNLSDKVGDFIWSMKQGDDEFMSMSNRIKTFVSDILGSTDIQYEINIDEEINKLVTEFSMRKNIVLIAKEAINNAAKYSEAKHIIVEVKCDVDSIRMCVADDGLGMNLASKMQVGNGLNNMQKRAQELHAKFDIISSPNHGTKVMLEFKLPEIRDKKHRGKL
ncbi:MAG: hypothetical protein IPI46_04330 [Bacteroidetes bacterium]|nr:hypothetical protein [Bacteroidota bacterium]